MSAVATISAGVITDNASGTVRRVQQQAGDGRGGAAVNPNPSGTGGSTTGWVAGTGVTISAPPDGTFGPNFTNSLRLAVAAAGATRWAYIPLANVQMDLSLTMAPLFSVEGGGAVPITISLYDPTNTTQQSGVVGATITGDVTPVPVTWTPANINGQSAPLFRIDVGGTAAVNLHMVGLAPQPPLDSSIALYPASTPVRADSFGSSVAGYTGTNATIARDGTRGKFGSSLTATLTAGNGSVRTPGDALASGTACVASVWVNFPTGKTGVIDAMRADGTTIIASSGTITGTGVAQYAFVAFTAAATETEYIRVRDTSNTTYVIRVSSVQLETGSIPTPFVGPTGTRSAARVQLPGNLISQSQGWMAWRFYPSWAYTAAPNVLPRVLSTVGLYSAYDQGTLRWTVGRDDPSGSGAQAFTAGAHAANQGVTLIAAWDAGHVSLSLNAAAFVTPVANTKTGATTGTLFDIGDVGSGTRELYARMPWVVGGTGDYTKLNLSKSYWTADADPVLATINADSPGAGATFVYPCNDATVLDLTMDATGTWAFSEAYSGTFMVGPARSAPAQSTSRTGLGTPVLLSSYNPGSAHRLQVLGVKDANGVALDTNTTLGTIAGTAYDGSFALATTPLPFVTASQWGITQPGDSFSGAALVAFSAALTDLSGSVTRLTGMVQATPADPVRLDYAPLMDWPIIVTGLTLPTGWSGTVSIVDQGGRGAVLLAGGAMEMTSSTSAAYNIPGSLMQPGAALLVTVQFYGPGGDKVLARRYLLTAAYTAWQTIVSSGVGPVSPALALLKNNTVTTNASGNVGNGGNAWGVHHAKIARATNGDVYALYSTPGTPLGWTLAKQTSGGTTWVSVATGADAGREPPHLLVGPTGTLYVVSWPDAGPWLWDSVSGINAAITIGGASWWSNNHPYAFAGISPAGDLYIGRSTDASVASHGGTGNTPGTYQYAWRRAVDGVWHWADNFYIPEGRYNYFFTIFRNASPTLLLVGNRDLSPTEAGYGSIPGIGALSFVFDKSGLFVFGSTVDETTPDAALTLVFEPPTSTYLYGYAAPVDAYVDTVGRLHVLTAHRRDDADPTIHDMALSGGMELVHSLVTLAGTTPTLVSNTIPVPIAYPTQHPDPQLMRMAQDTSGRFYLIHAGADKIVAAAALDGDTDGTHWPAVSGWTTFALSGDSTAGFYSTHHYVTRPYLGTPAGNVIDGVVTVDDASGSPSSEYYYQLRLAM